MSDEFKVQWSISLPPCAQYAKGHMLNIRDETVEGVVEIFDQILAADFIEKAASVAALLVAANVVVQEVANEAPLTTAAVESSQQAAQQNTQPQAGSGKFCPHGQRTYRSGTSSKGAWTGYFCPLPKGSPDQCKPEFA